ncbi:MAG: LLM class F420-dependent oxidoreductase [Gammaproteobacteria bacterium]|nr:LLM class F420-dependent oxidoreductase [Gammaproteobacteria bacterium]MBI5616448.1 LLM class F420-dependent oxidoreductase [Gammaproteobacteria bacterium]
MSKKTASGIGVGVFQVIGDLPSGDPAVIAKRAEELGFHSYWLPEHTVIPKGSCDDYPGRPPNTPVPEYLFKMPDPFIGLTRAAAVTKTIKLGTGVCLVPERNPLLAAKQIATLDHYSGGRFQFGIGAGWNEPECTVLGGDFDHRWAQTKESIAVMKKLWTGEYVEHHGKYYDFGPLVCLPKPGRRPHPPVLLGSIGSPLVFKRVVEWGDGWVPVCFDPKEIADGKAELVKLAKAAGRDPDSLEITAFGLDGFHRTPQALAEIAKAGAQNAVIWLQGGDEKSVLAELEALAAAVF